MHRVLRITRDQNSTRFSFDPTKSSRQKISFRTLDFVPDKKKFLSLLLPHVPLTLTRATEMHFSLP